MSKTVVYGAGSIGCYIGGILAQQGVDVCLLGRERIKKAIEANDGIGLSDYEGRSERVAGIAFATDPAVLSTADVVLVTLKCTAMESAAAELAEHCKAGALVVCMQNGVGSDRPVREQVSQARIELGIVPFNVVQDESAHFHRATEGSLHLPELPEMQALAQAYQEYGLPCSLESDMQAVIWGKLMLNLNNAINALSDQPLKTQLLQRGYRQVLAGCQDELLAACAAKGIRLAQLTAVAPNWLPRILRLPDFLYKILAQKMLAIDPQARSSMWEDIHMGRNTEIDFLNGAVVALAQSAGQSAPVNGMVVDLVRQLESKQIQGGISAAELLQKIA